LIPWLGLRHHAVNTAPCLLSWEQKTSCS
jgi:hypothetical protein